MIEVEDRSSRRKIERLAQELNYVSSTTFLNGLGLKKRSLEALSYLLELFPDSSSGSERPSSRNEFGMQLKQGFYANTEVTGTKVAFIIGHRLQGNERAMTVLNSLDKGTRAYSTTYDTAVSFLGDAAKAKTVRPQSKSALVWFRLAPGRSYYYSARPGHKYVSKTRQFIERVILPELKEDFDHKVKSRMERI